jgi:hypothetical protein
MMPGTYPFRDISTLFRNQAWCNVIYLNTSPLKYQDTVSFKCPDIKRNEIKYQEDEHLKKLFDLLLDVWRNLQKNNVIKMNFFSEMGAKELPQSID